MTVTAPFDYEPDDAYDAGDPWLVRLDNVLRRIAELDAVDVDTLHAELLDLVAGGVARLARRHLTDRDLFRLGEIVDDLDTLREELAGG